MSVLANVTERVDRITERASLFRRQGPVCDLFQFAGGNHASCGSQRTDDRRRQRLVLGGRSGVEELGKLTGRYVSGCQVMRVHRVRQLLCTAIVFLLGSR